MRKIRWVLDTGFGQGGEHSDIIEVDDDATDEAIDRVVFDEVLNCIIWYWDAVEESGGEA